MVGERDAGDALGVGDAGGDADGITGARPFGWRAGGDLGLVDLADGGRGERGERAVGREGSGGAAAVAPVAAEIVIEGRVDEFDGIVGQVADGGPWEAELVVDDIDDGS